MKHKESSIEREVFPILVKSGKMFSCLYSDYWIDIGTPQDFIYSNCLLLRF